jgi:DNA replication protein DnaC
MILNTNESVFLTGKAGTGKSALLSCIKNDTEKKYVVLAPTAVARLDNILCKHYFIV